MYNNEYFKEIMGNQYKESDLYANTYNKNNKNFVVITPDDRVPSYENVNFGDLNSQLDDNDEKTLFANNRLNQKYALKNINENMASNDEIRNAMNMASKNEIKNTNENTARKNEIKNSTEEAMDINKFSSNNGKTDLISEKNKLVANLKTDTGKVNSELKNAENDINKDIKKVSNNIRDVGEQLKDDVKKASSNIMEDIDKYYPEIYKIINPMIEAALSKNGKNDITNEVLEKIVNEIYYAIDGYDGNKSMLVSKNQNSSILYDLIKIILLDKLIHKIGDNNRNSNKQSNNSQANNGPTIDNQANNIHNTQMDNIRSINLQANNNQPNSNQIINSQENNIQSTNLQANNNQPNSNQVINSKEDNIQISDMPKTNINKKISYLEIPFPEDA